MSSGIKQTERNNEVFVLSGVRLSLQLYKDRDWLVMKKIKTVITTKFLETGEVCLENVNIIYFQYKNTSIQLCFSNAFSSPLYFCIF